MNDQPRISRKRLEIETWFQDHQYEMGYEESTGHVTDDVTRPRKVKYV